MPFVLRNLVRLVVVCGGLLGTANGIAAEKPLVRFASAPDIHCLEEFLQDPPPQQFLDKIDRLFAGISLANPDFLLMPGDLGSQDWWFPGNDSCTDPGTASERVNSCANRAYSRLNERLKLHNLQTVHVAVGDHEVGDNDWQPGIHSDTVPTFKRAFARHFTQHADGSTRYPGSLNGVPLRPEGTPYADTAYAFLAANTLFVVVDQFRQDAVDKVIGRRGTVRLSVDGDGQIQWLERLLSAARADTSITHIIVVGHMPVLGPVRASASSLAFVEYGRKSRFWKTLRKYEVDAYLAGEVHATTAIKDPATSLMQITHTAGCGKREFMLGSVFRDRMVFQYQFVDLDKAGEPVLVPGDKLVVRKPGGRLWSSVGESLRPIDPQSLLVHYAFDDEAGFSTFINNAGQFGTPYNGKPFAITPVAHEGMGMAASFSASANSRLEASGMPSPNEDHERTISAWIRGGSNGPNYLFPYGKLSSTASAFRLFVEQGVLGVELGKNIRVMADQGQVRLNDHGWHFVAVSMPTGASTDEIRFYIDGRHYSPAASPSMDIFTNAGAERLVVGGEAAGSTIRGWEGAIDDFALWGVMLTQPMLDALHDCANSLGYNASDMNQLFTTFKRRRASVAVGGRNWQYVPAVDPGASAACAVENSGVWIRLGADGSGLRGYF